MFSRLMHGDLHSKETVTVVEKMARWNEDNIMYRKTGILGTTCQLRDAIILVWMAQMSQFFCQNMEEVL